MNELKTDLESLLVQINTQIEVVEAEALRMEIDPAEMRMSDGSWPMLDLLVAKAQVASVLAQMRPSVVIHNAPPRRRFR